MPSWLIANCFLCLILARPDNFSQDLIREHNSLRRKHQASTLSWSGDAARIAQRWADHLASTGRLEHGPNDELKQRDLGQNLAFISGGTLTAKKVADMWYDEIKSYDFNNPGFATNTGHFTQLVWRGTKQIGVGRASKGQAVFVVANYYPAGNVLGNFEDNVKPATNWNPQSRQWSHPIQLNMLYMYVKKSIVLQ